MKNTASKTALKDISEYLRSLKDYGNYGKDVWIVTPSRIFNKETTKLNIELGLHKINKCGSKMARFGKNKTKTNNKIK